MNLAPPPDATVKPVKFTSSNLFFKRYRQGLADIISPSYPPNPLPEMCCFDPGKCCCVYYETGDSKESSSSDSLELGGFLDHRSRGPYGTKCFAYHTRYNSHGFGRNGDVIKVSRHWPNEVCGPICMVTAYRAIFWSATRRIITGLIPPTPGFMLWIQTHTLVRIRTMSFHCTRTRVE